MQLGIVAAGSPFSRETAGRIEALAAELYPASRLELTFHPNCFCRHGHFAGSDAERLAAFVETANDPRFDAIWFARGGYGACRIAADALARLDPAARGKLYLGYSDAGTLLAALYRAGYQVAHGPMCQDIEREGGAEAVVRALRWLVDRDSRSLEPGLSREAPHAAFNMTVLGALLGTPLEPDLSGHILLLEETAEHLYAIDRQMYHITANAAIARSAGIRLGRCGDIPANDREFGQDEEEIARFWCERQGIAWLGRADIGHDIGNRVVPFGLLV